MLRASRIALFLLLLLALLPLAAMNPAASATSQSPAAQTHGPKLLVMVVYDQMAETI